MKTNGIDGICSMSSLISWLDASSAETTRMREIVRLFEMPESIDDLALGQFRDSISNSLFPGTSVLHVAARYLLLVPWCIQAAGNAKSGELIRVGGEQNERKLIRRFNELELDRFIGRFAGERIAQLPSAAYWSALRKWGIVRDDVERSTVGDAMLDETSARRDGLPYEPVWNSSMPRMPEGFPGAEEFGMELNRDEAEWIRDRVLTEVPGTLLAQLLAKPQRILKNSYAPWADPSSENATGEAAVWLSHGEAYSALQYGLDAVYAYIVTAEARNRFEPDAESPDTVLLDKWHANDYYQRLLRGWDISDFVAMATEVNPRIQQHSIVFLKRAVVEFQSSGMHPAANDTLHRMVREREKRAKGANSRFVNEGRLRAWERPAVINRQTFRWNQVRTMVLDVKEGLSHA